MADPLRWLSEHKFQSYLLTFCFLIFPPIALYFTAQSSVWVFTLVTVVAFGNVLAILIR